VVKPLAFKKPPGAHGVGIGFILSVWAFFYGAWVFYVGEGGAGKELRC